MNVYEKEASVDHCGKAVIDSPFGEGPRMGCFLFIANLAIEVFIAIAVKNHLETTSILNLFFFFVAKFIRECNGRFTRIVRTTHQFPSSCN